MPHPLQSSRPSPRYTAAVTFCFGNQCEAASRRNFGGCGAPEGASLRMAHKAQRPSRSPRKTRVLSPSQQEEAQCGEPRQRDHAQEDAESRNVTWIEHRLVPHPDRPDLPRFSGHASTGQSGSGALQARLDHTELTVKSRHTPRLHHAAIIGHQGKRPVSTRRVAPRPIPAKRVERARRSQPIIR